MRQADIGGDKPFVDYAGDMLIEIDPTTDAADRDGIAPSGASISRKRLNLAYVVARIAQGPLIAQHGGCQFSTARHYTIRNTI